MKRLCKFLFVSVMLAATTMQYADAFTPRGRWPNNKLNVRYKVGNAALPSPAAFSVTVNEMARKWNLVTTAENQQFVADGTTNAVATLPLTGPNGTNEVIWAFTDLFPGEAWLGVTLRDFDSSGDLRESDIYFNSAHAWATDGGSGAYDLATVAVHEFGHCLSLGHVDDPSAVMSGEGLDKGQTFRDLTSDDIAGKRFLYGNPSTSTSSGSSSSSSAASSTSTSTSTTAASSDGGGGGGGGGGGCFIATACWGSAAHPAVDVLRRFRDVCLLSNTPGQAFVSWYYGWSPPAADWLRGHNAARMGVLVLLVPLVILAWLALHPWMLLGLVSLGLAARFYRTATISQ